jgi:uncharacterized protein YbjT (DUF2867 family)
MTNSVYAVTGASGHLGRLAVQELLARGVPSSNIVAIVRTRDKVTDLAQRGVDVRVADYTRPDTVRAALVGVNRLLLVSSSAAGQRLAQHTNVIARQDYAVAAVAALRQNSEGNRTYELGGSAFDLFDLAETITKITSTNVRYRDLPVDEYVGALRRSGLDENAAEFVAALDASISRGDLETNSQDLEQLLGRPATSLADVIGEARHYHA